MIKKINLLIKYGKASMSGFKVSLFIMQQPLASAGKGKEKKEFFSGHSTTNAFTVTT